MIKQIYLKGNTIKEGVLEVNSFKDVILFLKRNMRKLLRLNLKYFSKKINNDNLVKVYSHPRSGTHFLEAFVGENFYQNLDLKINTLLWGHWSNRLTNDFGNPYGKLFGNHEFPPSFKDNLRRIYIVRDGRAVAYSIWKTPNFINKNLKGISFEDFLKIKIDWTGTPSIKSDPEYTILEHWFMHIKAWEEYAKKNKNVLIIKYENLIKDPYIQYSNIHRKFFRNNRLLTNEEINVISEPVGLLPNKAKIDTWKEVFSEENNLNYLKLAQGLDFYKNESKIEIL